MIYKTLARLAAFCWQKMANKQLIQYSQWVSQDIPKILRELKLHAVPKIEGFFVYSTSRVTSLIDLRINLVTSLGTSEQPTDGNASRSIAYLTRHIRQFGKLFQRMQKLNPTQFVQIKTANDVVLFYWSKVVQAASSPENAIAGKTMEVLQKLTV